MNKSLVSLVVLAALAVSPAGASAASVCPPTGPGGTTPSYCIPPATPSAAAHASAKAAAAVLGGLTPSALASSPAKLQGSASGPGVVSIVLTAKVHGRTVVLGSGSASTTAAGTVTIQLRFTRAGKSALSGAKGKLRVTVSATFKPKHGKAKTAKSTTTLK